MRVFQLGHGFEKKTYWSKKTINAHRNKYSKETLRQYLGVDFDGMAKKDRAAQHDLEIRHPLHRHALWEQPRHGLPIEHENHLLEDGTTKASSPISLPSTRM